MAASPSASLRSKRSNHETTITRVRSAIRLPKLPITPPCESGADHLEGCGGSEVCSKCKHPCP